MHIWIAEKILLLTFLLEGVCCRDFSISLPEKIQALSGSCVIIKCRFDISEEYDKDLTERAAGVWYKDKHDKGSSPVFKSNASTPNSFIKGNVTGQLKDKDCTTVFYNVTSNHIGQYFFRIEGEGGLKWTYKEDSVSVEVIESPVNPRVVLYVDEQELQDQQEVLEGRSVSLRCSAETLCSSPPATLTWSSTARIPFSESSKLQELIISDLNFTAAQRHHRVTFTCSINYQLQDNNRTAHSSITLHVQYAPQISNSSCTKTNVTVCFCEADGNPSPEVEWHLSERLVSNSSNTFISEERLSNTSLRSFISLHQSLTHTNNLLCVSKNTCGNATQRLQLTPSSQDIGVHSFSVLIGVAVGLSLIMMCIIIYCVRKNCRCLQKKQEDTTGVITTDGAVQLEDKTEYANYIIPPPEFTTIKSQESLHYASVEFKNIKQESKEMKDISSLTTDYAVINYSGGVTKTESSVGGDQPSIAPSTVMTCHKDSNIPDRCKY
ncbi:sialic acid-binding Ig-like lectin 12 [Danio aesculapii]|uniref:sialic acid-binding Ig-like lectin 12 n=1 Tax=Danio aesculapii TaxID=1142201 RepID=UPI0024C0DBB4|nr:sialic acid-binding Ig-like lectin 12 [Danio aesculapii]